MTKNRIVLFIGLSLFLIPFLGFPSKWEAFFQVVFGIALMAVSFSSTIERRSTVRKPRRKRESENTTISASVQPLQSTTTQDSTTE